MREFKKMLQDKMGGRKLGYIDVINTTIYY